LKKIRGVAVHVPYLERQSRGLRYAVGFASSGFVLRKNTGETQVFLQRLIGATIAGPVRSSAS
jgi:hypothetical protein